MTTFEEYVREHGRSLVRFAAAVTADPAQAEDVVQTVLARLHGDWARVAAMPSREAYVRRAIVNEHVSWRRKWARQLPFARVPELLGPDHADTHATRSELATQIARLPARQRAALVMRYYGDLSDAEIADALGCRPVTVRGYVARALRTLRVTVTESLEDSGRA